MLRTVLKKLLNHSNFARPLLNPLISSEINSLEGSKGVNDIPRKTPIIISLTSERENFSKLPETLYSLLNQKTKPDKIILWLNEETEDFASPVSF